MMANIKLEDDTKIESIHKEIESMEYEVEGEGVVNGEDSEIE